MEMEKFNRLNRLYDAYSGLLSKRQAEVVGDYLLFGLTISEIAQNRQISRQAVLDSIKKGTIKLEEFENKTGLAARIQQLEKVAKQNGR